MEQKYFYATLESRFSSNGYYKFHFFNDVLLGIYLSADIDEVKAFILPIISGIIYHIMNRYEYKFWIIIVAILFFVLFIDFCFNYVINNILIDYYKKKQIKEEKKYENIQFDINKIYKKNSKNIMIKLEDINESQVTIEENENKIIAILKTKDKKRYKLKVDTAENFVETRNLIINYLPNINIKY